MTFSAREDSAGTFNCRTFSPVLWTIAASVLCGFFVFFPLTNSDIWWHLAAGREMMRVRDFLRVDPFAYTASLPWIDLHWLFQIAVYLIYSSAGAWGLVISKCLLVALSVAFLVNAIPGRHNGFLMLAVPSILFFEMRYLVLVRPTLVTVFGIAVYLYALERYSHRGSRKYLAVLVPLQIVWTNSQGLFLLGPAIASAYALGHVLRAVARRNSSSDREALAGKGRTLIAWTLGLTATCLVNPWWGRGLLFPFRLLGRIEPSLRNIYALNVSENMPLLLLRGQNSRYLVVTILCVAVLVALFVRGRTVVRFEHLFVCSAFLALAVMAHRNVALFLTVAIPVIVAAAGAVRVPKWLHKPALAVLTVAVLVMVGGRLYTHARILAAGPLDTMVSPFRYPQGAVDYLRANPVKGHVFNSIRYGGYLTWSLYPSGQMVYIDGRLIIRTPQFFANYLEVLDEPWRFDRLAAQEDISCVVLMTSVVDRYLPLAKHLYRHGSWKVVYVDESSVVFADTTQEKGTGVDLCAQPVSDSVRAAVKGRWERSPALEQTAFRYFDRFETFVCGSGESGPVDFDMKNLTQKEVL